MSLNDRLTPAGPIIGERIDTKKKGDVIRMLMNITAFVCFAIVIGVMAAMKLYTDRSETKADPTEKRKTNKNGKEIQ